MKKVLVFTLIICVVFLLIAGAQEVSIGTDEPPPKIVEPIPKDVEPAPKPVTHLKVTLIDGINDRVFELKNCMVQIMGDLNICDNTFPYQKTFINGTDYEITIMIKPKD